MSDNDIQVWETMRKYGGSFAKALAAAMVVADSENLRKIKTTWPELFEEYARAAALDAERNKDEWRPME